MTPFPAGEEDISRSTEDGMTISSMLVERVRALNQRFGAVASEAQEVHGQKSGMMEVCP